MSLLEAKALSVDLGARRVLDGISLAVQPGQLLALIGPNGAGKTTLLRSLAGLVPPQSGELRFGGRPLGQWDRRHLARELAYLPQAAEVHWPLPVAEVVELGRLPHRDGWRPDREGIEAVAEAMRMADVQSLAGRIATELSGGERARVLLARALAGRPKLLLADEPVAGLDPYHRLEVMECLAGLADQGMTIIVVLHDLTLAARFCDRVALLHKGRLAAEGEPRAELTLERLAEIYRVEALTGERDGRPFVVPWRRLESDAAGAAARRKGAVGG